MPRFGVGQSANAITFCRGARIGMIRSEPRVDQCLQVLIEPDDPFQVCRGKVQYTLAPLVTKGSVSLFVHKPISEASIAEVSAFVRIEHIRPRIRRLHLLI